MASANRDPARWEDPDRFDVTRRAAGHLSFGTGIHGCVGQLVARMEGGALLTTLARTASTLEPAGEPRRSLNNTVRGFAAVPVRVG